MNDLTALNELCQQAHAMAREKGWYDGTTHRTVPESIALMHSELSEALEAYRNDEPTVRMGEGGKPEGLAIELADCVIRIADFCGARGIDLGNAVAMKMAYNATRPHRHGGKLA